MFHKFNHYGSINEFFYSQDFLLTIVNIFMHPELNQTN